MTHDEVVNMKDFNEWWDSDIIRSSPFRRGSPKYWAWAAWEAALREHAMSEVQRLGQEIQPEQEPVGKFAKFTDGIWREVTDGSAGVPLYTTPPQTEEKLITTVEIEKIVKFKERNK